ncbi:MAG: diguanylate cyclase [Pseudomonadota bacterium]
MRILKRLVLGFGCVVAVSAVQFSFNIFSIRNLGQETVRASTIPVEKMDAARTVSEKFSAANSELNEILKRVQHIAPKDALKRFSTHTSEVRSALSRLEAQKSSQIVSDSARQAREAIAQWEAAATALIGSTLQTSIPTPHKLSRLKARVHSGLRSVAESVKIETANSIALIKSSTNAAIYLAILSAIVAFGIGIAASVSTGLSLTRPLARVQQRMKDLMAGDVTSHVPHVELPNEIGEMARAVQVFQATSMERAALNREAQLLSELTEWLQSCKSMNELYDMVADFLSKLLPDCPGSLYIYANSRDVLEGVGSWNGDQAVAAMHPDDCWALRRGRTYTYGQSEFDFRCSHVEEGSTSHYCCIPILAHGETIGLLHIDLSKGCDQTVNETCSSSIADQKKLALLCAEQISLAIANAKLRDELQDQSIRDALTGMYNRRYALETCRREFSRATRSQQSVSILSIDVDHFKKFNDNHGHDAGDTVLRSVADCLMDSFRDDDVASRFGGEEFVVILPNATPEQAEIRAEKVRAVIEAMQVRYLENNLPRVSVSIGVAAFPQHGRDPTAVLRSADEALYGAKDVGRNCVVVAASGQEEAATTTNSVAALQETISAEFRDNRSLVAG